jgi:hypothetical protein
LARVFAHCETGNRVAMAPSRVADILVSAFKSEREGGSPPYCAELQALIRRMAAENRLWGQRRIQAELARLGFNVSARTVAKYMQRPTHRRPSPGWRLFLKQHAATVWACDFFCVQTILFRTFYVFFVIHHASRQVLHVHVTPHPTAEWTAQQIMECCGWDYEPPRFLIHDGDNCYGTSFNRRVRNLGITQARRHRRALGEICRDRVPGLRLHIQ